MVRFELTGCSEAAVFAAEILGLVDARVEVLVQASQGFALLVAKVALVGVAVPRPLVGQVRAAAAADIVNCKLRSVGDEHPGQYVVAIKEASKPAIARTVTSTFTWIRRSRAI